MKYYSAIKEKNYQLMDESQNSYHQWNMADWKKKRANVIRLNLHKILENSNWPMWQKIDLGAGMVARWDFKGQ